MNTIYFPIASYNLSNYFRTGLVTPTQYIENRNKDIQEKFKYSLLLCSKKFTNETDCSLEIVLTKDEMENVNNISEHFSLCDEILPISRVKNIFFKEESQKNKTIWNIRDGAAFIPDEIISVSKNEELASIEELYNLEIREKVKKDTITQKLVLYNRLLGGFALMRLGGENWMNFSKNYFPSIALLNEKIEKEWKDSEIKGENKYEWLILRQDNSNKRPNVFAKEAVYADISMDKVEKYAKEENIKLEKKLGVIQLDSIEEKSYTYLASILAIYDENGRKNIDDFVNFLMTGEFDLDRKEGISLMFGINKGYKAFRNRYKTTTFEVDVKFRLDSQLDYYIVESIYQYVFNDIRNNFDFPYIDYWCPKLSTSPNFERSSILDKNVILKKKVAIGSSEYLQELYKSSSPNKIYEKITTVINTWLPAFFRTEKVEEGYQYFEDKLKGDLEDYTRVIYDRINDDFNKANETKHQKLSENLDDLQKRYDKLVLVNEDLNKQINNHWKEEEESYKVTEPLEAQEEQKNKNITGEIFPEEEWKVQEYLKEIKIRRDEMENLKINDLRERGNQLGILNTGKYKGDKSGKKELANEIIKKEFPNQDI